MTQAADSDDDGSALKMGAEVAAFAAHPNMPLAVKAITTGLLDLYQRRPILNRVMNDRVRLAVSHIALYLHYSGQGLTTNRFKQLCVQAGLGSPGRAVAVLALMRFAGMLKQETDAQRGQRQLLVPSESLLDLQRERFRVGFEALSHLSPVGAIGLTRLQEPDFFGSLMREIGNSLRLRQQPVRYAPKVNFFFERNSGAVILAWLILAGNADDTIPPTEAFSVSIAALARRFAVSRIHVARTLAAAEEEHLLERDPPGSNLYRMMPELRETITTFTAALLALLATATNVAMQPQGSQRNQAA
jgi:hypothetical protein